MTVVTRFAPSPTGYLHIGGARTALFNFLFARNKGGKFLLRIEDTDKERSTSAATEAIFDSLSWLGLYWDGEPIFQSSRASRHVEVASKLLKEGKAYYCFSSQEEIAKFRNEAIGKKESLIFRSPWRDADPSSYPNGIKPAVRLKVPETGSVWIRDELQGDIEIKRSTLDDMVLLRSDSSPTYMLAVVADDIDMGITHIIRGDEHLTNAARQIVLYEALGASVPKMVHIPLIHGSDGAKLSKRHGALGVEAYRDMGYLPEALANYLLRLGWSSGNDEIISLKEAIDKFDLAGLGKSPSRLDFDKLNYVDSVYIKKSEDSFLLEKSLDFVKKEYPTLSEKSKSAFLRALPNLKDRANNLRELANLGRLYFGEYKPNYSAEALEIIKNTDKSLISESIARLSKLEDFTKDAISSELKKIAEERGVKLSDIMLPLRCLVTGSKESPSVAEIISLIGKEIFLERISVKIKI